MRTFLTILLVSVVVALLLGGSNVSAVEIGDIHCDYNEVIEGYMCSDYNEWYAPSGQVSQDMIDYYVGYLGYEYPTPNPEPDTFYITGGSTENY